MRFSPGNSHFNNSETNNYNTSNIDDVIGNSNLPRINIHTKCSLHKLITLQKKTDTQLRISNNNEITDDHNKNEEISCHQNSEEVIDHTCDDNGDNLHNIEEVTDATSIHYINATTNIYMNYDKNYIHKYYAPLLLSNNHEDVCTGSEYD